MTKIEVIDMNEQCSPISDDQRLERENLRKMYHSWLWMEEIWRQKSRIAWLKFGDNNTRFFHWTTNHRNKMNTILGLYDSGSWVSGHTAVVGVVSQFFKDLLTEPFATRLKLNGPDFKRLPAGETFH